MAGRGNKGGNKAFAVAGEIALALKRGGFVTDNKGLRQFLFDNFKQVLGAETSEDSGVFGAEVKKFMDNPMTPDEEARALRAILHAGLSKGNIPPQLLEKLDKIIGVSSGEDDEIHVVDWSTAFPDLATAVYECREMLKAQAEGEE